MKNMMNILKNIKGLSLVIFLLFAFSLSAQWTNTAGTTAHDHTTDNILFSGSSMTGSGTKYFWDEGKLALRLGLLSNVNSDYWDVDSLGTYSFSMGTNTKALGFYSFSFGEGVAALGSYSIAMGANSEATDFFTLAIGDRAKATNPDAIALGKSSEASGSSSVAIGNGSDASASSAIAIGQSNTSSGSNSISIGALCEAKGALGSMAIGYNSVSNDARTIAIGYKTESTASNAHVIGSGTTATTGSLVNNIPNSIILGANSSTPTMFIGGGSFGDVGIGTTNPLSKLDVAGDIRIGNGVGGGDGKIRFTGTDFQGWANFQWNSLINTDDQSLSISGNTLSISGGNSIALPGGSDNWGTQVVQTNITLSGNGTVTSPLALASQGATTGQVLEWNGTNWAPGTDDQGTSIWNQSGSNINYTNGNIGIGIAAPVEDLHIESAMPELKFTTSVTGSTTTDGFEIGVNTGSNNRRAKVWQFEDAHLVFATNNLERMRIHKTGSVGIGTLENIPEQMLEVVGAIDIGNTTTGTAGAIRFDGTDFEGYDGTTWKSLTTSSTGGSNVWSTNGTDVFYNTIGARVGIGTDTPMDELHVEGNITVTGEIRNPSDRRLKTDIADVNNAIEIIRQLSAKTYNYTDSSIEEFKLPTKKQYGFIAQELKEVLPSLVKDDILIGDDGSKYMGLNYQQLIPILVAALNEEHNEKEQLKEEISKLKKESQMQMDAITAELARINETLSNLNAENVNKKKAVRK